MMCETLSPEVPAENKRKPEFKLEPINKTMKRLNALMVMTSLMTGSALAETITFGDFNYGGN